jgi:putative selenate reductase molybdopterin-binding subunit
MSKKNEKMTQVGHRLPKLDGLALVTGSEKYTADEHPRGMLYAKILTSPHAHANIVKIDTSKAWEVKGVKAILTWEDVPRVPHTTAGQGFPEPSAYDTFMLDKKVRFVGDRVAAVAATTPEAAAQAAREIDVQYEQLRPILDPRESMKEGAPVIHDEPEAYMPIPVPYDASKNLAAQVEATVGDVEKGFGEADAIVEAEYEIHQSSHCAMEPHTCMTYLDPRGRLVIRTSTQVAFHVRRIVAARLQIPVQQVRVIKPRIGGGFGGKQEVLLEDICSALTLKTRQPVLLEYSRAEEFASSRTRHPQILRVKAGAKKDGTLTAYSLDILMNTGAYGCHALTVVCNSGSKTLPLYRWQNIYFKGTSVYTNLPVGGAYRGYGATQAYFPLECLMDELAEKLELDPLEFRKQNAIRLGETSPIFQALGEGTEGVPQTISSTGLIECIEKGAEAIGWNSKWGKGRNAAGPIKRGVGCACLMQGSSVPEIDMGAAYMKINEDGSFNLQLGASDIGTGSDTILGQIAAEKIGTSVDKMIVYSSDTDMTPFDVGAYASSTTYLTGEAVRKTALDIKEQLIKYAAKMLTTPAEEIELKDGVAHGAEGRTATFGEIATHALYISDQSQIQAVSSHISHKSPPPFSAQFAEVEVDTETGEVKVLHYVGAIDCGTAINPQLAEGQNDGAMVNGISYALLEEFLFDRRGKLLNTNFNQYKTWATTEMPKIETILVPTWEPTGPYGAKSVSEIGINGPVPAIANAIYDAIGVRLRTAPFTAEKVLRALGKL